MEIIRDMWNDRWFGRLILALMIFLVLLIPVVIYGSVKEQEQWEEFAADHTCKKVGQMSGSMQTGVGFGVTPNGQIGTVLTTTSTPSKTGWLCDDGVTYWR